MNLTARGYHSHHREALELPARPSCIRPGQREAQRCQPALVRGPGADHQRAPAEGQDLHPPTQLN